jgi:hypothetical protein
MADWQLSRGLIRLVGSVHAVALHTLVELASERQKGIKRETERDNDAANCKKAKSYL